MKIALLALVWVWTNNVGQVDWSPSKPEGGYLPGSLTEVATPPQIVVTPPPQQFPTGIESPSIAITQTNGAAYGLAITPSLDVVAYPDHASPRDGWEARKAAAIASNMVKMTALRSLKTSPEYTGLITQLSQYEGHYMTLTNLIATADLTKTNKVQQILTKQQQSTDDLHDAIVKLVKLVKDIAGNQ